MTGALFDKGDVEFYGVDISREMISECTVRFGHDPRFHFSVGGIDELPFSDFCFDLILCLGVIEYVPDPVAAVREIARVLKPGGTVIATMLNPRSPYRIWDASVYPKLKRLKEIIREPEYIRNRVTKTRRLKNGVQNFNRISKPTLKMYTQTAFVQFLNANGLKIQDIIYYGFNLFIKPLDHRFPELAVFLGSKLEFLCRSKLKFLGTGFIVKARKDGGFF
jgi:ubiquinone/menaquinone biosynthesis C-methylase UbiE